MNRTANQEQLREARLKRLAEHIDLLSDKDAEALRYAREIASMRSDGTAELYGICAEFVRSVNHLLQQAEVMLDPPEYPGAAVADGTPSLIQINVRGRILQVQFKTTPELVSTEDFRVPYTLEGFVRAFNQELLEKDIIEEQLIFFTLEKDKGMWRFFDPRTYRSGPFDQDYLISLMEQLL